MRAESEKGTTASLNSLPDELLQTIWGHLLDLLPTGRWNQVDIVNVMYSHHRALLPCRLAATCRRWRHVALSTPELWTYIALSCTRAETSVAAIEAEMAMVLYYVDCQLQRSQQHRLELVLGCHCHTGPLTPIAASNGLTCIMALLRVLIGHAHRWRFVKIVFPFGNTTLFERLMVGVSTPVLEGIYIAALGDMDAPWLASSPCLRILYLRQLCLRLLPGSVLTSVTAARLSDAGQHMSHFLNLLQALPCLTSLALRENNIGPLTGLEGVRLDALISLRLRGSFPGLERLLTQLVFAPRLASLCVEVAMVGEDPAWGRRFFATYPNISYLEVHGSDTFITPKQARALNNIKRVQHAVLVNCRLARNSEGAAGVFTLLDVSGDTPSGQGLQLPPGLDPSSFDSLRASGLVWPELQRLQIVNVREPYHDELLNDLLAFVRTRAIFNASRGAKFYLGLSGWPAPFPSWFLHTIGYVLGPDPVHLMSKLGTLYLPVGTDGAGTEDEATSSGAEDSDGSSSGSSEDAGMDVTDVDA